MTEAQKTILSIIDNDFEQELKDRYPHLIINYPKSGELPKFIMANGKKVLPPEFFVEVYVDNNYFPKSYEIKNFLGLLLTSFFNGNGTVTETTIKHLLQYPDCQVSFRGWQHSYIIDNKSYFYNIVSIAATATPESNPIVYDIENS